MGLKKKITANLLNIFTTFGKPTNRILNKVCRVARMEVIVKRRNKKIDGGKIFSIIASLAIVAALGVGIVSIVKTATSDKDKNYIDLNVADNATSKEEQESKKSAQAETQNSATEPAATNEYEPQTEIETEHAAQAGVSDAEEETPVQVNAPVFNFNESSSLLWPVEGEIILGYNMDNTIYFPTLDQYKCNPSIIISASEGTVVQSAAAGIVEDIYEDAVIGTVMVVSIGDGYKLTYGQLGELNVGISDTVEVGTELAKVAEPTRYFTKEGSNLYFELTKDGKPVDPMMFLIED